MNFIEKVEVLKNFISVIYNFKSSQSISSIIRQLFAALRNQKTKKLLSPKAEMPASHSEEEVNS
jgi:hypothetical protein